MQPVLKYEFKFPIAAKVPDIVGEDFTIKLTSGIPNIDCEDGRFMYQNDVIEDGRAVPFPMKFAQNKLLPTMKTDLISVSYQLEIRILHNGVMGLMKKYDIPSIYFPINVQMNPRGPFD